MGLAAQKAANSCRMCDSARGWASLAVYCGRDRSYRPRDTQYVLALAVKEAVFYRRNHVMIAAKARRYLLFIV